MTFPYDDQTEFAQVAVVERSLSGNRRLVQPPDAPAPTQLAGSAPIIWDLLGQCRSVDALLPELQSMFTDSAESISNGIRAALGMFLENGLIVLVGSEVAT